MEYCVKMSTEQTATINNIEYIINNTKILTEFVDVVKQIRELVKNLPNTSENQLIRESVKEIEKSIQGILLNQESFKSLNKSVECISDIEDSLKDVKSVLTDIQKDIEIKKEEETKFLEDITEKVSDTFNIVKYKLPLIIAIISLLIYGIGFIVQVNVTGSLPNIPSITP